MGYFSNPNSAETAKRNTALGLVGTLALTGLGVKAHTDNVNARQEALDYMRNRTVAEVSAVAKPAADKAAEAAKDEIVASGSFKAFEDGSVEALPSDTAEVSEEEGLDYGLIAPETTIATAEDAQSQAASEVAVDEAAQAERTAVGEEVQSTREG